jgi:hypothetical protein
MKLLIKYGNGSEEEVITNAETKEAFINEKFGSAFEAFVAGGGKIVQAKRERPPGSGLAATTAPTTEPTTAPTTEPTTAPTPEPTPAPTSAPV